MILDDGGDATLLVHLGAECEAGRQGPELDRRGLRGVRPDPGHPQPHPARGRQAVDSDRRGHQGRHRGDHHRGAPPLPAPRAGQAPLPCHQRQRLGHQVQVRQPLRVPPFAHRRDLPGHRRDDRRQGGVVFGFGDVGKGCAQSLPGPGRPGDHHRDRPHLRPAGGHGGLPGPHPRRRGRHRRHLRDRDRQPRHRHRRRHGPDEAQRHRLQHRPFRQRDRHGRPGSLSRASPRPTSSPRSTPGTSPTATRCSCWPRAGWSTWAAPPATPAS